MVASVVRETFGTRFGTIMTMVGVAVGLGNIWRFPYMARTFGGAAFVLFYLFVALVIGVPALMAAYALGRHTRRGTVGAFAAGGLPFGTQVGWFFFSVVVAATGYYSAVIGWVLYYALAQGVQALGLALDATAILPPDRGFVATSFFLQLACTGTVIGACALVLVKGLRSAGGARRRRRTGGAGVALLLDPLRGSGRDPRGRDLVAAHQCHRRTRRRIVLTTAPGARGSRQPTSTID